MRLISMFLALILLFLDLPVVYGQNEQASNRASSGTPRAATKSKALSNKTAIKINPSQKLTTTGFSYFIEPTPQWVKALEYVKPAADPITAPTQIVLKDEQIYLEAKRSTRYLHMEKRVHSSAGLNFVSQIQIEFDPAYQELALHKIEVLRGEQRIDKLEPRRVQLLQRETQLEARMYDGRITASIVLDDVRVGDTIAYSYSVRGSNPVFDNKFSWVDSVGSSLGPITQYQARIVYPEGRAIHYKTPADVSVETQTLAGMKELLFKRNYVAQQVYEESSTVETYTAQFIQVSEFKDWNEVATWGANLFLVANEVTEKLERHIAPWKNLATSAEKIRAALDFVQKEVRYFGTEIGINSHKPSSPDKVLEQRYGDCKDKTTLLIAMLRAMNISARPVLASTNFREETDSLMPSPLAFNHVIATVNVDGKDWWLDPTRDQQIGPFENRSVRDYGKVLVAHEGSTQLTQTPDSLHELHQAVSDQFQLQVLSQEPILISTSTYYGALAERMRAYLARTPLSEVQTGYVKPYLYTYPKILLRGEMKVVELPEENALRLVQEFDVKGFWTLHKIEKLKASMSFWSLEGQLSAPKDISRKSSYQIPAPGVYRHTITSELSEDLLDPYKEESYLDGQAHFTLKGSLVSTAKKVTWVNELAYHNPKVKPEQWRSYSDKIKQTRAHFHYQLLVNALDKKQLATLEKEQLEIKQKYGEFSHHVMHKRILLYANTLMQSKRLSPELNKFVLMIRANSFQVLNQYELSAMDINKALDFATEPDPSLYSQAAMIAFSMHKDDTAYEFVRQGLEVAPHDRDLNETKIILDYFSGQFDTVSSRSTEQLVTRDSKIAYLGLLRHVAMRKLGQSENDLLDAQVNSEFSDRAITALLKFFMDKQNFETTLRQGQGSSGVDFAAVCQVYFYAGEKLMLDGNLEKAKEYWRSAVKTGMAEKFEYMGASRRLEQFDTSAKNK